MGIGRGMERGPDAALAVDLELVTSFPTYAQAQQAVDRLSDASFPVQHLRIVGNDLRLVEKVTGRLTKGRAALAGAASGVWLGLLVGLLVGLFTPGRAWLGLILAGVVLGALWGAVFGFVAHGATGGRRDFSSWSTLVAQRYDVMADSGRAGEARRLLEAAAGGPAVGPG
jgi:hypothetical protein